MARIVLVDDHPIFREGLEALIDRSAQDEFTASLGEPSRLHQVIQQKKADVVLMDLSIEGRMTFDVISTLKDRFPALILIVLSMHGDQPTVERAMQAGADGYALKQDAFEDLLFAIRAAERGGRFISPTIIGHGNVSIDMQKPDVTTMPERQRQILTLLAEGKSNKQIASDLGIALPTVKNHLSTLFRKYGVSNRVGLLHKLDMISVAD
ncbi:response regulator transcription factor [Coralliovum pocilloporae]|uniref:response regulator transcription factor n=1 Tax=Coralliovum pocilloporae TaxID=3066369 RepID=UPI003306CEFD